MSTYRTERHGITVTGGDIEASAIVGPRLHMTVLDYLSDTGIVAAGWLADGPGAIAAITLDEEEGQAIDLLQNATMPLTPDLSGAFGIPPEIAATRAFVFFLPDGSARWAGGLRLGIHRAGGEIEHRFVPRAGHFSEIGRIIELALLDQALGLAELLLARWDTALEEDLPPAIEAWMMRLHQRIGRQQGAEGRIDEVVRAGTDGMLLRGHLPAAAVEGGAAITLVGLDGRRVIFETPLPAIAPAGDGGRGFAVFAAIPGLRPVERFWFLELGLRSGRIERISFICPAPPPALRGIEAALALTEPPGRDLQRLLEEAVAPTVDYFWLAACRAAPVTMAAAYGAAGASPVSVIIRLDGRIDHIRHQIAQLSNDPDFRPDSVAELIYVVDDVSVTEGLPRLCESLHGVYGVPFRTIVLDRSRGLAGAGNAGASAAHGDVLLFLGGDLLPKRPRWVGQLLSHYRALDRCGVLGCRLLFEDGSIRHGGITFRAAAGIPGLWEEHDSCIGLPSRLASARAVAQVPAVSGACLMIDRALFQQLGGFSEEYVFGGFADCDLCLAAQQHGWHVYCTPEVELYQLAAAAPAGETRWQEQLTRYNRWKHSRKWSGLIPTVLAAAEA